jgi:hypothetical protein
MGLAAATDNRRSWRKSNQRPPFASLAGTAPLWRYGHFRVGKIDRSGRGKSNSVGGRYGGTAAVAIGSIARSFLASSATGWPRPHPPRRRSRAPSAKKKSGESLFRGGAIFRRRPFCYLKGGGAISWSRPCPPQIRSWARSRARRYLEAALFFGVGPFLTSKDFRSCVVL